VLCASSDLNTISISTATALHGWCFALSNSIDDHQANPHKQTLARKHFYLSSSPFDLVNNVNLKTANFAQKLLQQCGGQRSID